MFLRLAAVLSLSGYLLGCGAATGFDALALIDADAGVETQPLPPPDAAVLVPADDSGPAPVTDDAAAATPSDTWCGFELGGSMNVSIVGSVISAATDGTEVRFIGLTCNGTAGGDTYSLFGDYLPGTSLSVALSSSKSTGMSSQGCSTEASLNGSPVTMLTPYAVGDALTITFSSCESPTDPSVPFVTKGQLAAILSPKR